MDPIPPQEAQEISPMSGTGLLAKLRDAKGRNSQEEADRIEAAIRVKLKGISAQASMAIEQFRDGLQVTDSGENRFPKHGTIDNFEIRSGTFVNTEGSELNVTAFRQSVRVDVQNIVNWRKRLIPESTVDYWSTQDPDDKDVTVVIFPKTSIPGPSDGCVILYPRGHKQEIDTPPLVSIDRNELNIDDEKEGNPDPLDVAQRALDFLKTATLKVEEVDGQMPPATGAPSEAPPVAPAPQSSPAAPSV